MISLLNEFELAFGELPNEPISNTVLYLDNNLNPALKLYVSLNIKEIKRIFHGYGLDFIYLKDWIDGVKDSDLCSLAKYYIPWFKDEDLDTLRKACAININELQSRLIPKDVQGATVDGMGCAFKIDVSDPRLFREQFRQIAAAYSKKRQDYYFELEKNIQILYGPPPVYYESEKTYSPIPELTSTLEEPSLCYGDDITTLFERVRAILPEWAVRQMLLDKLQEQEVTSRIEISYKKILYLPDYNISIRLRPVEMAFYILFLKHPEGINFKDLLDYRSELMRYYKYYATTSNPEDIEKAIDSVVNPLNDNNRNVQRSRIQYAINEAFKGQFCEAYAQQYMITGEKGKDKKITLPREKVIWLIDI